MVQDDERSWLRPSGIDIVAIRNTVVDNNVHTTIDVNWNDTNNVNWNTNVVWNNSNRNEAVAVSDILAYDGNDMTLHDGIQRI